ncbi:Uncharacterized protein Adt_39163 [Abeliophyllum distichum]|uniref:Uncharacterized protein n=1 Tax=Abeliophyllum distichum TaxID=126358 RepID=A0ABD1Q4A2_9LAMI
MPRMKMAAKQSKRERSPSSSSSEEEDPQTKRIDRCAVVIGKNVDLASFTFDAPSFNIENLFVGMVWVPILTLNDKVYPAIIKDFYTKMNFSPGTDEVNHYDVFLLDSILRGCKLNFSYIMFQHMNCILSGTRAKALPYGMILTKNFQHFKVLVRDSVTLLPKATNTINTLTLKRIKIFKQDGQWVAKSKGFDDESGPSTLPFEGKEMDVDEDEPLPRPCSQRSSSSAFEFTEDHFNLLNGWIDLLTFSVEGLHNTAEDLRWTMGTLQSSVDGIT